nr:IS1634 family transposase [Pelodictyon luteolum]
MTVRKVKTASGATAVQVVRNEGRKRVIIKHVGSAHNERECEVLPARAESYGEAHQRQPGMFAGTPAPPSSSLFQNALAHTTLISLTRQFSRNTLFACARKCGLGRLPELYLDLALMRIIEPTSKLRTLELLQRYFNVSYLKRTAYRTLSKILEHQEEIETAAIQTACNDLKENFCLVLYDVTTLYFESFKEHDFQKPGFSKDNKPRQPHIVIGLITTRSGFPVMHEVFEGNTFEGNTMLDAVHRFQERVGETRPLIVADASMLSTARMQQLENKEYRYIAGARLADTSIGFIEQIHNELPRMDTASRRFSYAYAEQKVSVICEFSEARYKKDKREFDKQVERALKLLERNETGRRAKFLKKSKEKGKPFVFDTALQAKAEKLLGIKGYVTNIPEQEMPDAEVVANYRDLWHVEQAFRMNNLELKARPIFHHTKEAIRSHILVCFMAMMMGKYLEIKTGRSLRQIRDELWRVQEANIRDELTGEVYVLRMDPNELANSELIKLLDPEFPH